MALRTTAQLVRSVINTCEGEDLHPHMISANALVDYVVSQDTRGILTSALAVRLETYLAAFFYAIKDQQYSSKSVGGASSSFQVGQAGPGFLQQNDWGRTALGLDITGTLVVLNEGNKRASLHWLGKRTQERQDWNQRNVGIG